MLASFFDITKDAKAIFKDTEIMQTEYSTVMNTYPTIFLSFADAKGDKKNKQVLENIDIFENPAYDVILRGMSDIQNGSLKDVVNAISFLMTKCHQYYGKRVMLFIDE